VKGQVDAHARDGAALAKMLEVDLKGAPVAGAPLLDATGSVVGVLVRACKGAAPGAPPRPASRSFWARRCRPSAPSCPTRIRPRRRLPGSESAANRWSRATS